MRVEYKRDLKHNYMVIWKPEENFAEPYCIRMLEEPISGAILLLQQHSIDNQTLFYYEITGKQSMNHLLEKQKLSYNQLRLLIEHILAALEEAYEHLLPEDDFILAPEYIYLDIVTNMPSLCFLSGYRRDSRKQISILLEYLMNKVNYGDQKAVMLVYQLYGASREEGFTLGHIAAMLHDGEAKEAVQKKQEASVPMEHEQENRNIPVVMERIEEEKEICRYPVTAYLLTGVCAVTGIVILVLGFTSGLLYNSYGKRIEYGKLLGLVLILLCIEAYLMKIIWNSNHRLAEIISTREYIDPRQEDVKELPPGRLTSRERSIWQTTLHGEEQEQRAKEEEEEYNPTCILNKETNPHICEISICLKSSDETLYPSISLEEFPFFIGKLRRNVDYCLEKSAVSRYHAKITKEKDNYFITDLNSTNGTYVNGAKLASYEKREVKHGDRVALADINFEFSCVSAL